MVASIDDCWVVGDRRDNLKRLIDMYKFEDAYEASMILAQLLDSRLPHLPQETIISYVPDIASHRRQRGHDHMATIARSLARQRQLVVQPTLTRLKHRAQHGLGRTARRQNQQDAFAVSQKVDLSRPILLLDDIYTTGATLRSATTTLKQAGVKTVYTAIIARQPIDQSFDL